MQKIHYTDGWTPIQIANVALRKTFPTLSGLCFRNYGVVYALEVEEKPKHLLIISVAGTTDIGSVEVIIDVLFERGENVEGVMLPVSAELRTEIEKGNDPYRAINFELCTRP